MSGPLNCPDHDTPPDLSSVAFGMIIRLECPVDGCDKRASGDNEWIAQELWDARVLGEVEW